MAKDKTNKSHSPITEDEEIMGKMDENVRSMISSMVKSEGAGAFLSEFDAEMENDPQFREEFETFEKGLAIGDGKAAKILRQEVESLTNAIMTMTIDPNIERDGDSNYEFPYERVAPAMLRRAGNSVPARLIKQYRFHQLAEFTSPSDGKRPGFQLAYTDEERKVSDEEKKNLSKWEMVLAKKFFFVPNDPRPNFTKWLQFAYGDFFDMDKVAIEVLRQDGSLSAKHNFRGKPLFFVLVDAATIKHVIPKMTEHQGPSRYEPYRWDSAEVMQSGPGSNGISFDYKDDIRYLQVDNNGQTRQYFSEAQMMLHHAFGTTDMKEQFQGYSIIEQSLQIIRYIIDSIIYNATRRSAGQMPKGLIHVEGATEDGYSRREMALFRKLIWGIASGKKDHWKYPIVGTPKGVKTNFVRFHESSKEMEDFMWFSTLLSIMCSFAGLSPEQLELASQKSTLGKAKLFAKEEEEGAAYRSQDEGLRFFLNYMRSIINSSGAIEEMTGDEEIELRWVGLDVEDEAKKLEMDLKILSTHGSMNDLLVAQDKKPFTLEFGDVNIYDIPGIGNQQVQAVILEALRAVEAANNQDMGFGEEGYDGEDNPDRLPEGGASDEQGADQAGPDYLGDEGFDDDEDQDQNDKKKVLKTDIKKAMLHLIENPSIGVTFDA